MTKPHTRTISHSGLQADHGQAPTPGTKKPLAKCRQHTRRSHRMPRG